ncbi:hypothetical protein [Streptomyces sp. NPDC048508]|uniref:hypothetical protein n=1 Tax=Streptomyces sp. NPDC048508 TaxID=3365561 RepID=UPI00371738DF
MGAITGTLAAPRTLLVGRYDTNWNLTFVGRATAFNATASNAVAPLLSKTTAKHHWKSWTFSAGWGSREALDVTLVEPDVVGQVGIDVARDSAGRWRHPAHAASMRHSTGRCRAQQSASGAAA